MCGCWCVREKSMCDLCAMLPSGCFVTCGVSSLVSLGFIIGYIIGYIVLQAALITESDDGIGFLTDASVSSALQALKRQTSSWEYYLPYSATILTIGPLQRKCHAQSALSH